MQITAMWLLKRTDDSFRFSGNSTSITRIEASRVLTLMSNYMGLYAFEDAHNGGDFSSNFELAPQNGGAVYNFILFLLAQLVLVPSW